MPLNEKLKKQKARLLIQTILRTTDSKIKIDKNVLTKLLTVDTYEMDEYVPEDYDALISFYTDVIKYADLSEIVWEDVIALSSTDIEGLLYGSISNASMEYDMNNRLKISEKTLKMSIFDEWAFLDKETGLISHHFVPKFNEINIEGIDLSEINFDNVIFDVKEFFKKYLVNKDRYEVIFSPDSSLVFLNMGLPLPEQVYGDDDLFFDFDAEDNEEDFEFKNEEFLEEETYDEDIFDNYDEEEIIYEYGDYDEDELESDQEPEIMGLTEDIIEKGTDYYIELSNSNAFINFKTNEFGKFSDVNFIGTDLSNSHLEECDGIHIEYCNLGRTNAKLPKDSSNIIGCSFERSI